MSSRFGVTRLVKNRALAYRAIAKTHDRHERRRKIIDSNKNFLIVLLILRTYPARDISLTFRSIFRGIVRVSINSFLPLVRTKVTLKIDFSL